MGIVPTTLTLNADGSGTFVLMGAEMPIGWTDTHVTIGGQPMYAYTRLDSNTIQLEVTGVLFTLAKNGAQSEAPAEPVENPAAVEATEAPAEPTEAPAEPTEAPAAPAAAAAVEPYGDSDGVIERETLAGLYQWMNEMASDFRYSLTFDEISAAAGKLGCDKQNGDGNTHGAYWTDGKSTVTVSFKNRDGNWVCNSIVTDVPSSEYKAADISGFPKTGSSVPAGTVPTKEESVEVKANNAVVTVKASLPERWWYAVSKTHAVRFACTPDESNAQYCYSYIHVEFYESEEKLNFYLDSYENLETLDNRTIAGIDMPGRTYSYIGMDWIEYYGEVQDGVWVSVRMSGVDFSAGTETEAIVDSLAFSVQ